MFGIGKGLEGRGEEEKKVADPTSNGEGSKKNNLGPCESGFLDARRTRQDATALPVSPPFPCSASSGTLMRTCLGSWVQLGASWLCSHAASNHPEACELMRRPSRSTRGGWGVSVKGGNLGSEGLELATPDRQPLNSYRDTHLARVLARARWSTLYLGQARRSLISWMTWRIRPGATNEERVTFDNLLLPPASQPASQLLLAGTETVRGMPR